MKIKLSDHFTFRRLLRFTLPSVVMLLFSSAYSIVDGLCVSNLLGSNAMAAVNIAFPVSMIIGSFGFMLGTGGSAIVARTLGEGDRDLANRYFSLFIYAAIVLGGVLTVISLVFIHPIMRMVGASDILIEDSVAYGAILLAGSIPFMLQTTFQSYFIVAERPHMGLVLSIGSGIANMALDYIFIAWCDMGIAGAGLATVIGYAVGGIYPLFYFMRRSCKVQLRLTKTSLYPRQLLDACVNGSSELMSNLATSLVGILYNIQLMRIIGEDGVAAYSVMMYVDFVFIAAFFGYSMGSAPITSYHYGAGNWKELRNVHHKNLFIIIATSLVMVVSSELLSRPMTAMFVSYDPQLMEMTIHGFRLFALGYFFCGFNTYASSYFTALCNGTVSAFLSFVRTLVLRSGMIFLLPVFLGLDGIWLAIVVAEGIGMVISALLMYFKGRQSPAPVPEA